MLIRIKIPDAPTLFPLPEPHQHRKSYEPVDFDKLIEERCETINNLLLLITSTSNSTCRSKSMFVHFESLIFQSYQFLNIVREVVPARQMHERYVSG